MAVSTQTHKHTRLIQHTQSQMYQLYNKIPTQTSLSAEDMEIAVVSVSANITDITVEHTTGLHKSCFQEPAIVFFTAWVILQAMPEGHWSLSTLPGNGLLVRMGLEGSLRFLCVPLLKESYVELVWT